MNHSENEQIYHPNFVLYGETSPGGGVLAMFAYGGVRAMFLGLKFHLKAIFLGLKFSNMNVPFFWG